MIKKIDYLALKLVFILTILFIVGYCTYPYVISNFISIEQANKYNIKKFEHNKVFFQEVIDTCIDIYREKYPTCSKKYLYMENLPIKLQKKLINQGINYFEATLEINEEEINIIMNFHTERCWYNAVLNHVILIYNSYRKDDICNKNNLKAYHSTICLGAGWFFEIDTDWL